MSRQLETTTGEALRKAGNHSRPRGQNVKVASVISSRAVIHKRETGPGSGSTLADSSSTGAEKKKRFST